MRWRDEDGSGQSMTRAGNMRADLTLGRVMMRVQCGIVRSQQRLLATKANASSNAIKLRLRETVG
jgi:hypothetical protein